MNSILYSVKEERFHAMAADEEGVEVPGMNAQDNVDQDDSANVDESVTELARKEFDRPDDMLWHVTTPIIIKNLSLSKQTDGGFFNKDQASLEKAPNFATAIFGKWLATKLRLNGPVKDIDPASSSVGEYVFQNVNALLMPGEGTLVLGPSSSGKTTFMTTVCDICTKKPLNPSVKGIVLMGNMEPKDSSQNLTRTGIFCDQTDLTLTPILTVEETVRFARRCAEEDRPDLEQSLEAMLRLVGLDHVKGTVVGNADIRGVSGGQKRRVKVLEMCVGSVVRLAALDEITNGLDAATAYELSKIVRIANRVMGTTTLTTLLQPSSEVFATFDRLILFNQNGQVAFTGKTEKAVPHFQSLGFVKPQEMNEAEFVLRCATSPSDLWDTESGEIPESLSTPSNLANSFPQSETGKEMIAEMSQVEQEAQPARETNQLDDFAQPTRKQIRLLLGRGWKLVARNPASIQRVIFAIIFGAFIGTLFLNTKSDAFGTNVRAGYILTLLFLIFINSTSAPLDELFADRLTFYTHRRATFYRTCSYYFAQVLYSAVVPLVETFFLALVSFFAVGMNNRGGGGFCYFWAIFSLMALSGASVSRVLAFSLPSNDMAQSLAPAVLLLFILSAGYSPQYTQIPGWIRWLSWISPCGYCYEGAIVNEVRGRNVGDVPGPVWAQENLGIPRIPYTEANINALSSQNAVMAFDAGMLIVLTIVFDVAGCLFLHHSQKWYGPTSKRYQVTSRMSLAAPPWYGTKSKAFSSMFKSSKSMRTSRIEEDEETVEIPKAPPAQLTAKDIVYEVDVPIEDEKEEEKKPPENAEATAENSSENNREILSVTPEAAAIAANEATEDGDMYGERRRDAQITMREYGQLGKGAAQERVIKRQLGEKALRHPSLTSSSSTDFYASELPPPEPGRLRLLSGITASFEPGTMTALMGSSGAGKSTLLDVLAGYKTGGYITGDVNINSKPKTDETWRSIAGYCEQVDLHNPVMTVLESLVFAARLRLRPFTLPDKAKTQFASSLIKLLDLQPFEDMLVGDEAAGEGLPKHARKRLTVGVEMAGNPSILFADEPTSGLDSLSAAVVISCLERAAKQQGLTVVCTIHQPSREVFAAFDNLLLLRKGGVCVYNGAISALNDYIGTVPNGGKFAMQPDVNPADHVLAVFCGSLGEGQNWGQLYKRSEMAREALAAFEESSGAEIDVDSTPPPFTSELWIVTQRAALSYWRTPSYMAIRFHWTWFANLLVGLIYLQTKDFVNIIGAIFFYVNIATVPLLSAIVPLISERAVFYREVFSGTYRRQVYGIAVQIAEMPFNFIVALVSFVLFYFMVGLKNEAERIIYFLLMALATYWVLPTFGQLFAFVSPNIGAAVGLGSLLLTLFTLTMGFLLPASEIPAWYIWIYWINPLRYIQQGLTVNEVGGDEIGDEFLNALTWSYGERWWYCYVAVVLFGLAAGIGIVAATRISWLKR